MLLDEVKGTLCSVPPPLCTTDFHDFDNLLLWAMSLLPPFKNDAPCLKTTFNATKAQGENCVRQVIILTFLEFQCVVSLNYL